MRQLANTSLLPYNTFNIDVKTDLLIEYESVEELQELLISETVKNKRILTIGGGSNLLFLNDFNGVIIHSACKKIQILEQNADFVLVEVEAGVVWDDFVAYCVEHEFYGLENLSLIPGEVGASAVQNIGAYGVEAKDCIHSVHTVTVASGQKRTFLNAECQYGYRESIFKKELKGQYIVSSVVFKLDCQPNFTLNYQHLESEVLKHGEINLKNIRETIINIRNSKLPDTKITGNAGSFFMNPIVDKTTFEKLISEHPVMPHYYVSVTQEKLSAAWLIDQCEWKGKIIGKAGVHNKQALVLINCGGASGKEIVDLSKQIQESVYMRFGVRLQPEVNFID